jgi:transposase
MKKQKLKKKMYEMYRNNEIPTADAIKEKLMQCSFPVDFSTRTFKKLLHAVGFCYKRINKRLSIMESERLRVHRTKFIREIREYGRQKRNIVYLDETWFDTHEVLSKGWVDDSGKCQLNVPPARGKRVIILHAGNEDGWVNNGLLLSAKNISKSSADYHQDMDSKLFEKWFKNNLVPNLSPRSIIVMDNASYHSRQQFKIPNTGSKKAEIIQFMEIRDLNIPEKATKTELLNLIKNSSVDKTKTFYCDSYAAEQGHTVLRLPPYYCVLNPIELVWSQLKHGIRKSNKTPHLSPTVIEVIREEVSKINQNLWINCVNHVKKI